MAGDDFYPAGMGPVGDAARRGTPNARLPVVPSFDPLLRDVPLDANGEAVGVHPVDQEVAVCLSPKGSFASAPDTGLDMERIAAAPANKLQAVLDDETRVALRRAIDAGDVAVLSVHIDSVHAPRAWTTHYRNLRLPGRGTQSVQRAVR